MTFSGQSISDNSDSLEWPDLKYTKLILYVDVSSLSELTTSYLDLTSEEDYF